MNKFKNKTFKALFSGTTSIGITSRYMDLLANLKMGAISGQDYDLSLQLTNNGAEPVFSYTLNNDDITRHFSLALSEWDFFKEEIENQHHGLLNDYLSLHRPSLLALFLDPLDPGYNGLAGTMNYYLSRCEKFKCATVVFLPDLTPDLNRNEQEWLKETGMSVQDYLWLIAFKPKDIPFAAFSGRENQHIWEIIRDLRRIDDIKGLKFGNYNRFKKQMLIDQGHPYLIPEIVRVILSNALAVDKWNSYLLETN